MGWISREHDIPLIEPEFAPYVFLDGCSFEIKNGLLYVLGWQHVTEGGTEERRIVCRGVIPLVVAAGLHKDFGRELLKTQQGGN